MEETREINILEVNLNSADFAISPIGLAACAMTRKVVEPNTAQAVQYNNQIQEAIKDIPLEFRVVLFMYQFSEAVKAIILQEILREIKERVQKEHDSPDKKKN